MAIFAALCGNSCRVEQLDVFHNNSSDTAARSLASVLTANKSLKRLNISGCKQTTAVGWRSICLAMQSPACTLKALCVGQNPPGGTMAILSAFVSTNLLLEKLNLCESGINNATAISLANALASNNTLTELNLTENYGITDQGWSAFSRALCNPLSIMSTFQSNHTLRTLGYPSDSPLHWERVQSLLRLNRGNSKREAARHKIIDTHFRGPKDFAVQPFVDMDLVVLPRAIAWMSRHSVSGRINEHFYGFLRNTKSWLAGLDARVNRRAKKQKTQH